MKVRTIEPEELVTWVETTHVPFLEANPAAQEAEFRRSRIDFNRTWGAFDGERMVGTVRSFNTQLTTPGAGQVAADAVTNVAVHPTHRRRGVMTNMIQTLLARAAERHEAVSILIAAEYPIYGRFGYGPATEHAVYTLETQRARLNTERQGSVEVVSAEVARQEAPKVFEQYRRQQPGAIQRLDYRWDIDFGLVESPFQSRWKGFCALYRDAAGQVQGCVQYHAESNWENRVPRSKIIVDEMLSLNPAAYTGLWRFLSELDLVATVSAEDRPVDEPLYWQLVDARAMRQTFRADHLWVRILDLTGALSNRCYGTRDRAVIEVADPLGYANGRFALEGAPEGGTCRATTEAPDVSMSVGTLGAIYLGAPSVSLLQRAGRIDEHQSGAVARLEALFSSRPAPWCNTWF